MGVTNRSERPPDVAIIILPTFIVKIVALKDLLDISLDLVRGVQRRLFYGTLIICCTNDLIPQSLISGDNDLN